MTKPTSTRRADLLAALKQFKKNEAISLEDLGALWGVSKARFVNVRNEIPDFPEPIGKQGNALLYDARPAIECLVRRIEKTNKASSARSAKVAKILGGREAEVDDDDHLPPSEMLALSRAGAEIEKRRREQGQLVLASDLHEVAGQVFGYISQRLGKLSDSVDPNGRLPAGPRQTLDALGKDLLLRMHEDMSDMLGGNADHKPTRTAAARGPTAATRKPRVRRKSA